MTASPIQFEINPSSGVPIYRQLIEQVHALVAGRQLRPGDMLPSVRQVARFAAVNPMTVSKAYSRLEAEGVVQRVRGQGMRVVKPSKNAPLRERREQFRTLARSAIARARQLGLTESQIREVLDEVTEAILQEHSR